jgi:phage terminase large subunit-like protein
MESTINQAAANRALAFFSGLRHTQARWAGEPFQLLDWQRQALIDIFGTLRPDGTRQYRTVYIEVPKKNGKSEFASGIALYLLVSDGEQAAQVYSAATDRDQAAIVYNGAKIMVEESAELSARCRALGGEHGAKRIVVPKSNSYYRVLSAESYSKHGYNISGLVVDEVHAHKDRRLIDVLTKGSGAARSQPLFIYITTAGTDRNSICWELHEKALRVLKFRKPDAYSWVMGDPIDDPSFYAVIYGLHEDEDWTDEANWHKANPALGTILKLDDLRKDFQDAQQNVAEENLFKQLRLNIWVKSSVRWMKMDKWDACSGLTIIKGKSENPVTLYTEWEQALHGRKAYGGLDLASSVDLAALALAVPTGNGKYALPMKFWIPEDTAAEKEQHDGVPYRQWARDGFITLTPGNVIDYGYILQELAQLRQIYDFKELAYDRFGAWQLIQQLQEIGFITDPKLAEPGAPLIIPFGQGFVSMSGTTKEMMTFTLQGNIEHGGNPVLRWNADNMVVRTDPAGNIKPDKEKATQKIDGMVAAIMALDRAIRHKDEDGPSIYETRGF